MKGLIIFICILLVIFIACKIATKLLISKGNECKKEFDEKIEQRGRGYYSDREIERNQAECEKYFKIAKLVRFLSIAVTLGIFTIVALFNCFYSIGEQENAIVETFGKPELVEESGIHFKIPFIQSVEKVDTTIQGMAIGYNEQDNKAVEDECLMITNDYNFVNVDFFVEYVVSDPIAYMYNVSEPKEVFKNIVQASIRSTVSNYTVDEVLTTGKVQIQTNIKEVVIKDLESKNIGITLINVTVQDSEPPTNEVIAAFKAVETAKQNKETKINEAKQYASEKLPANEADVDKILQNAQTQKETRINEAKQQVAMFNAMYEEYAKDKNTTMRRMFFEAMEEILPDLKIIVNGTEMSINGLYPFESFTTNDNNTTNGGASNE